MARSGATPNRPPQVPAVDVAEARCRLEHDPRPFVLDVREPWEYATGHLPRATLIPLGDLERRVAEIPRDRPVLAVCHSGSRSWTAAAFLIGAGYPDVTNMDGGTAAWMEKGYPTER